MNEEEFITKFYSCDDEEQFLKDVYHNLNCLQQENKKINGTIQTYDILLKANVEENKKLKDNWNELKEFIVKEYYMYLPLEASAKPITILTDKMQELQGSK